MIPLLCGVDVGNGVGITTGDNDDDGWLVGRLVGTFGNKDDVGDNDDVGDDDGDDDGWPVGLVGCDDGCDDGCRVGCRLGWPY